MASDETPEDLQRKVTEQLNYYFGDINLNRDRYLRQKIGSNEGGFVTIKELMSFNKLKSMTQDVAVVVEAARKSDLLEVSEDGTAIRRRAKLQGKELPVDVCLVVSGWPLNSTAEEITEAIASVPGVEPQSCSLRKEKLVFNGEAFVEVSDASQAKMCIEKLNELRFRKTEALPELKAMPIAEWMARFKKAERPSPQPRDDSGAASSSAAKQSASQHAQQQQQQIVPGCLLQFEGLGSACTREAIRAAINARVSFIDYQRGDPKAIVRFVSPADCETGIASLKPPAEDSPFKFTGHRVLDETETNDYIKVVESRKKERFSRTEQDRSKQSGGGNANNRSRRGGGGRGDGGGRDKRARRN